MGSANTKKKKKRGYFGLCINEMNYEAQGFGGGKDLQLIESKHGNGNEV